MIAIFADAMTIETRLFCFAELSHGYSAWGHDPESTQRREKRYVGLKAACHFCYDWVRELLFAWFAPVGGQGK